ncbi:Telomerase Cajal body protein 1 [Chamberlinius hualienensis]
MEDNSQNDSNELLGVSQEFTCSDSNINNNEVSQVSSVSMDLPAEEQLDVPVSANVDDSIPIEVQDESSDLNKTPELFECDNDESKKLVSLSDRSPVVFDFDHAPSKLTGAKKVFEGCNKRNNFTKGCKWSPDGLCVLSNSDDNILRLFNLPLDKCLSGIGDDIPVDMQPVLNMNESGTVYDYCWYPLMNSSDPATCCLASTSKLSPVHMWDAYTGEIRCTYKAYNHLDQVVSAISVAFSEDGSKLYCGFNKMIRIFDVSVPGRNCVERNLKKSNMGIVSCIAVCPSDSKLYAAGSYSRAVTIYDDASGNPEMSLEGQSGGVTHLMMSYDGTKLYSGGRKDAEILCWDLRNPGVILSVFKREVSTNQRIYFDIDKSEKFIMSGSTDGNVIVWGTENSSQEIGDENSEMKPKIKFIAHQDCVNGVSFNPVFPLIATSSGQRKFPTVADNFSDDEQDLFIEDYTVDNSVQFWWTGSYNISQSVVSGSDSAVSDPWAICDNDEWPADSGEGDIEWRPHSRTLELPVLFNELACEEDRDDGNWYMLNGSRDSAKSLTDSRTQLVTIQDGDSIKIYLAKDDSFVNATSQHIVHLYLMEKMSSLCNSSGLTVLASIQLDKDFILSPNLMSSKRFMIVGDCHAEDSIFPRCFRVNITVKSSRCAKGNSDYPCSGKGVCLANNTELNFSCHCCPGYIGSFCEEKDGCHPNPCRHGGLCIDITAGLMDSTFQCLCPYGFAGKYCEDITSQCDPLPCRNNGTCVGNQTFYVCHCIPGFTGVNCEININECSSSPCVKGICIDEDNGYRCYCSPGFGGNNCQYEYLECNSNPCLNGGSCVEQVDSYYCNCSAGYTGKRCQTKVDLCQPDPCPHNRRCIDLGNNYTCDCDPGVTDLDCEVQRNSCKPNPCVNGGTCWSSFNTFFCACRPGYTGVKCQNVIHLDSLLSLEDQQNPIPGGEPRFDRLHNIYIVIGTLASALFIVMVIVGICHCRVNKTYRRFTCHLHSGCSDDTECQSFACNDNFIAKDSM